MIGDGFLDPDPSLLTPLEKFFISEFTSPVVWGAYYLLISGGSPKLVYGFLHISCRITSCASWNCDVIAWIVTNDSGAIPSGMVLLDRGGAVRGLDLSGSDWISWFR